MPEEVVVTLNEMMLDVLRGNHVIGQNEYEKLLERVEHLQTLNMASAGKRDEEATRIKAILWYLYDLDKLTEREVEKIMDIVSQIKNGLL